MSMYDIPVSYAAFRFTVDHTGEHLRLAQHWLTNKANRIDDTIKRELQLVVDGGLLRPDTVQRLANCGVLDLG